MFQDITVWCSNDYLGMSASHPGVTGSVHRAAVIDYGVETGGKRNIWGNFVLHEDLKNEIASLNKKKAALIFTSCYLANKTTLFTISTKLPDCEIFSDTGIRNSRVPKHNDPEHLDMLLSKVDTSVPKFEMVHTCTA